MANAILLTEESVKEFDSALTGARKKLWRTTIQPLRQFASHSDVRDSATVVDDGISNFVTLVFSNTKATRISRSLPDILLHSKLWSSTKAAFRQVNGYSWEVSKAKYWYVRDDDCKFGLFIFSGRIESSFYDLLKRHTIFLINSWGEQDPNEPVQISRSLLAFAKFTESAKVLTFDDAFLRHRLVEN
jgi:hypothetical protein